MRYFCFVGLRCSVVSVLFCICVWYQVVVCCVVRTVV